jgi:hypothetical protein
VPAAALQPRPCGAAGFVAPGLAPPSTGTGAGQRLGRSARRLNGVVPIPSKPISSSSQPGPPAAWSVPMWKRTRTVFPAKAVPRSRVTLSIRGHARLRPTKPGRSASGFPEELSMIPPYPGSM